MSKDKLPKIPSFAELGISEDEIEELEREIEKELEEARVKEEGRDPVTVPEGGKAGGGGGGGTCRREACSRQGQATAGEEAGSGPGTAIRRAQAEKGSGGEG